MYSSVECVYRLPSDCIVWSFDWDNCWWFFAVCTRSESVDFEYTSLFDNHIPWQSWPLGWIVPIYLSIFSKNFYSFLFEFELTPRLISGYLAWQGGVWWSGVWWSGVWWSEILCIKQFKGVVEQITFIRHCTNRHSGLLTKLIYIFMKWKKLWVIFSSILSYLIVVPEHVVVGKPP